MINPNVKLSFENCEQELSDLQNIKRVVGTTSLIMMFLTRYSLIKVCGVIELAYKTIIADFCETSQSVQVKNFILNRVRNSSENPTLDNIRRLLSSFDKQWNSDFKQGLNNMDRKDEITASLSSLNNARNDFAHGGNPNITLDDVVKYFNDSFLVIELVDNIINSSKNLSQPKNLIVDSEEPLNKKEQAP